MTSKWEKKISWIDRVSRKRKMVVIIIISLIKAGWQSPAKQFPLIDVDSYRHHWRITGPVHIYIYSLAIESNPISHRIYVFCYKISKDCVYCHFINRNQLNWIELFPVILDCQHHRDSMNCLLVGLSTLYLIHLTKRSYL